MVDDGVDALHPVVHGPRQAAGMALQVEPQRQAVHMHEGAVAKLADRVLGDTREQRVAELVEEIEHDATGAIGDDQHDRDGEKRGGPGGSGAGGRVSAESVRRPFVEERHHDRDQLGDHEHDERADDAGAKIGPVGWPDIGPELADRVDGRPLVGTPGCALRPGLARGGGAACFGAAAHARSPSTAPPDGAKKSGARGPFRGPRDTAGRRFREISFHVGMRSHSFQRVSPAGRRKTWPG